MHHSAEAEFSEPEPLGHVCPPPGHPMHGHPDTFGACEACYEEAPSVTIPIAVLIEAEQSGRARGLRFRMAEVDHEIWDVLTAPAPAPVEVGSACGLHEHAGPVCPVCTDWAARFGCPIGVMLGDGWGDAA